MTAHRWLGVSLAIGIAAAGFTSCKTSATAPSSSSGSGNGGAADGGGTTSGGGSATGGGAGTGGTPVDAGPIVCNAQYTNIAMTGCDLINQNCPPGYTCEPVTTSAGTIAECAPQAGLKTAGETCYGPNECDAKLVCIGQPEGTCVAFCCNDMSSEPCNGGLCNTQVTFGDSTAYAYVCSYGQRCMLLAADACPAGLECHIENVSQGLAVCGKPSPTPVAELGKCHYLNDCATMQDCYEVPGGNEGVCLYYCALNGPNTSAAPGLGGCPTGETCEDSYGGQPITTGVSGVGLCIPVGGLDTDGG